MAPKRRAKLACKWVCRFCTHTSTGKPLWTHATSPSCGKCGKAPLQGKKYSCAICRHFDLCQECFDAGVHSVHPFNVQEAPGAEVEFAPRGEADLENFEFKCPKVPSSTASSSIKSRHSVRPLKERSRDNNGSNSEQIRTPSQTQRLNLEKTKQSNDLTDHEGLNIEGFQTLSLMAVGTSVKSTPVSKTRGVSRGGTGRLRSMSRHRSMSSTTGSSSSFGVGKNQRRSGSSQVQGETAAGSFIPTGEDQDQEGLSLGLGIGGLSVQALGIRTSQP